METPRLHYFRRGRDMTRKRQGKSAEAGSLEFRLGIERSSDAVFMTAPDGAITYVNPAFERLYGYASAEKGQPRGRCGAWPVGSQRTLPKR